MARHWFHAARGRSEGPIDTAKIEAMIARGQIGRDTLVWRRGLADWQAASAHFAFPPLGAAAPESPGVEAAPEPAQSSAGGNDWIARVREAPPASAAAMGEAPRMAQGPGGQTGPDGLYIGAPYRSFPEAIRVCLSKYLTFRGRASRSEYWWFYLFTMLAGNILPLIGVMLGVVLGPVVAILLGILYLALMPPLLSVNVRRLHDVGRSGWWIGGAMIAFPAFGILAAIAGIASEGPDQLASETAGPLFAIMVGLAVLIGLAYGITMLVFSVKRGDPGPNRFG